VEAAAVAIIVGIVSGLAGTLLRVSHDRGAELRSRMLDAADGFSTRVVEALQAARHSTNAILAQDEEQLTDNELNWAPEAEEAFATFDRPVDDVQARLARVHLLFGQHTPAGEAATEILKQLRSIEREIHDPPYSVHEKVVYSRYRKHYGIAVTAHDTFGAEALRQLRDTWLSRRLHWLRQQRLWRWRRWPWAK
jgi:hypothetical protein